jgi:hypothetical protein
MLITAANGLTGMDFYDMGPQEADISEGRYPNGQAYWHFYSDGTPGGPNGEPVAVGEIPGSPGIRLMGVWPNPFNPSTKIGFELGKVSQVRVAIHTIDGRRVRLLDDTLRDAGEHRLSWDGRDDRGHELPSGIYFASVKAGHSARSVKLVLLK